MEEEEEEEEGGLEGCCCAKPGPSTYNNLGSAPLIEGTRYSEITTSVQNVKSEQSHYLTLHRQTACSRSRSETVILAASQLLPLAVSVRPSDTRAKKKAD